MTTKEKIEIMQHYENGGVVEVLNRNGTWSKKQKTIDGELYWSWDFFSQNYRKAENIITIECWIVKDLITGSYSFFDSSDIDKDLANGDFVSTYQKVKLYKTYEVEL